MRIPFGRLLVEVLIVTVLAGTVSIAIASSGSAGRAPGECLLYEPQIVSLAGTLRRKTFPGRPNYESVARGDEAETGASTSTSGIRSAPQAKGRIGRIATRSKGSRSYSSFLTLRDTKRCGPGWTIR